MKDKILEFIKLSKEPVRPGDISTALGIDKKEVDKGIKTLKDQGMIFSPKRCFYAPVE